MADKRKVIRLLKLLELLQRPTGYTADSLKELLEVSKRSVYRDLDVLKELDIELETDFENRYRIKSRPSFLFSKPLLEAEHYDYLKKLIEEKGDTKGHQLLRQLALQHQSADSLLNSLGSQFTTQKQNLLQKAIIRQKQIRVYNYHSTHSPGDKDRILEPISLFDGGQRLWALEVGTKSCKQFKLERMEDLEISEQDCQYQALHTELKCDPFGMAGEEQMPVSFRLTNEKAYRILKEEHPEAAQFVRKEQAGYRFKGPVCYFLGVGRFILSLPGMIEEVEPNSLTEHLRTEREKEKF